MNLNNAAIESLNIDYDDLVKKSTAVIDTNYKVNKSFQYKLVSLNTSNSKESDSKNENNHTSTNSTPDSLINITVDSFTLNLHGNTWYGRSSDFNNARLLYNKLLRYYLGSFDLINNHTKWESKFIPAIYDYEISEISSSETHFTYLAKIYYQFPFPLSNRVFYELIHLCKQADSFLLIQLPIDPKLFPQKDQSQSSSSLVVGRYTSVEKVTYDEKTDKLNWIMATIPAPEGSIPAFLTRLTVAKQIADDVPHFIEFTP